MSPDAGGLHCPNCGSPAAAGDRTCAYCHAELATVSCPSCFAIMFAGSAFCPHCGAATARAVAGETDTRCPACRAEHMRRIRVGPTDLLECAACGGTWVEAAAFERICADGEAQAAVLHQWPGDVPQDARAAAVHYRPCPACGRMMNRVNFARISGTVADVCKGHGTFLDAGELHQIVTFIKGGGLERSRQRQIDDLKEAERDLRAAEQARAVREADIPDRSVQRKWTGPDLLELLRHLRP
ncbi:MAG TPA: zinc ribbon domain-containing protein [Vicinamibacterales bacterium]|nr:zinc ribbon domain-containing protein [Vicinamibacterales bacterium]